jgi:6-pyruvoyltetrahydropterin/6-carboxytetrahydropterin synthase
MAEFEIIVSKSDFKFNCAHFIIYDGFRERLHGHNYQLSVRVVGDGVLNRDGYLIDFGDIKRAARSICSSLNEYFICPRNSPNMKISELDNSYCLDCDDGSKFVFPREDCAMLPIAHSSSEELAHYFYCKILRLNF